MLKEFLESTKQANEFIEDAVVSSAISSSTDAPGHPTSLPKKKVDLVDVLPEEK